jgi:signal transduction histidine kinase
MIRRARAQQCTRARLLMKPVSSKAEIATDQWRHQVLEVALSITSVLMPVLLLVLVISRRGQPFDQSLGVFIALVAMLVGLRFLPRRGFQLRAALLIGVLQLAGVVAVASSGLLPGSGMASLVSIVLTGIFFGRRTLVLAMLVMPTAYVVVGMLVTSGQHVIRTQDADPAVLSHWLRVAAVIGLLSVILGAAVDYVVRQVETGYRTAIASAGELRTAYDQLGMLHRRLELVKEEERSALARELHDEMGQTMTVLKLHMQLIFRGSGAPTPQQQTELLELVDRLIALVRKITFGLRPTLLDELGLEPALTAFIDNQARTDGGLAIKLEVQGITDRLPSEIEHACFRLVQEAITNTARHASAKSAAVRVRREQSRLHITVTDDGVGFSSDDAAKKAARGHLGIVGMRERVRLLGGEMTLTAAASGEPSGTRLEVTLPTTPPTVP